MKGTVPNRVTLLDQEGWSGEMAYLLASRRKSEHPTKPMSTEVCSLAQEGWAQCSLC